MPKEKVVEELPASLTHCSRLKLVNIEGNGNPKTFLTYLPRVLTSLPELPGSLKHLLASNCESLERLSGPLNTPNAQLDFTNCFKLDREARRVQQSFVYGWAILPGREVPAESDHRARGNSLTVPHSAFNRFKVCVVAYLPFCDPSEVSKKIVIQFSARDKDFDIIECGIQILTNGSDNRDKDDHKDTHEFGKASGNEDDNDRSKSESGEASDEEDVDIRGSGYFKIFSTHLPTSVTSVVVDLSNSGIERITECIKGLHNLQYLILTKCKRLASLPKLPCSLKGLRAHGCKSLERVSSPLSTPHAELNFTKCFKLGQQARQAIIQQSFVDGWAFLPGREVPVEFDHRARGDSLTIPHSGFNRFKVCVVVSPNENLLCLKLLYRCIVIGSLVNPTDMTLNLFDGVSRVCRLRTKHLFIFHADLPFIDPSEVNTKITLQFSCRLQDLAITECGIQILPDETD
ncbi:hypothetical protein ISN45_Aa02g008300 [Arabidopsis thaliana x Arabidopsis arenosa]|uniref:Uncharacterized protein n=1 Tax=Arabidopsis thaliana x Arabidopsis arenosa TaxID=1240361 RepID=A0A8T2BHK8_9BRAS|nr:hypothetical protein ISN45_Aa02g008300 [Arabidopsis thaliana x Arabidopsis arenosa]